MTGDRNKKGWKLFEKRKPSSSAAVNHSGWSKQSTPTTTSSTSILHQPVENHPSALEESLHPLEDGSKNPSAADSYDSMETAARSERKDTILAVSKLVLQAFEIGLKAAPIPNLDLIATGFLKFLEVYEVSLPN